MRLDGSSTSSLALPPLLLHDGSASCPSLVKQEEKGHTTPQHMQQLSHPHSPLYPHESETIIFVALASLQPATLPRKRRKSPC